MSTKLKLIAAALLTIVGASALAQVSVRGYTRKDGTYVAPHYRSSPNHTRADNYSTLGNINPYTGKPGTRDPGAGSAAQTQVRAAGDARQAYACMNSAGKVGHGSGRLSRDQEYSSFLRKPVQAGEFVVFQYENRGKEYWFKSMNCTRA